MFVTLMFINIHEVRPFYLSELLTVMIKFKKKQFALFY